MGPDLAGFEFTTCWKCREANEARERDLQEANFDPATINYDIDQILAKMRDYEVLEWFASLAIPDGHLLPEERIPVFAYRLNLEGRNGFKEMAEGGHELLAQEARDAMAECGANTVVAAIDEFLAVQDKYGFAELRKKKNTSEPYTYLEDEERETFDEEMQALDRKYGTYGAEFSREIDSCAINYVKSHLDAYRARKRA